MDRPVFGKRYRVGSVDERDDPGMMQLQTYRDVVREFRTHPEAKSVGADGTPCTRKTVGLLQRRVVQETYVAHVGKEANKLEEVESGLVDDLEAGEVRTEHRYPVSVRGGRRCCRCSGRCRSIGWLTRRACTGAAFFAIRAGARLPHPRNRQALLAAAGAFARELLREAGIDSLVHDVAACAAYLDALES